MGARRLLAVDLSNQVYRAVATHGDLTCEGTFTGGLYGFMASVSAAVLATGATDIVICEDRKPYIRSRTYPEYKKISRKPPDPEVVEAVRLSKDLVLEMAKALGLPTWGLEGFECDDLIAYAATHYRHRFEVVVAMSNDADLGQLFKWPSFRLYKKGPGLKDKPEILDRAAWARRNDGMTPDEYVLSLALQGTHNDVEGIPKVGPKTALKALRDPALMRAYRQSHGELIERNLGLISLPHPSLPRDVELPTCAEVRDFRALYKYAARYDITVTRNMEDAYTQLMRSRTR